jgi:hypothetical protein
MMTNNLPSDTHANRDLLKNKIALKTKELERLERMVFPFEKELITALESQIVEVQELTSLYKQLQKAKKVKRFLQKQKGKNFVQQESLRVVRNDEDVETDYEKKQRKALYREAMICVHPDKFSIDSDQKDIATDAASQLIDLYKNGRFEELQAFHAYVMSGSLVELEHRGSLKSDIDPNEYLEIQYQKVTLELRAFKKKQTYIVLTTYENPMDFLEELKAYYSDRIFKLHKRTRKAKKKI